MKCPVCLDTDFDLILQLSCGGFDYSYLYDPLRVYGCRQCGHMVNSLSEADQRNLLRYYSTEYSLSNMQSPNESGDLPGSMNENSLARYSSLFNFSEFVMRKDSSILDIGCATGGFLNFLYDKGYSNLHGIEPAQPYVVVAEQCKWIDVRHGTAESIPFGSKSFDIAFADQVLEHLIDPNKLFIEAKRVLKRGGFLCVSVPDAMLYDENYFFDFYWFLMREHVQHFDLEHLILIGRNHGFKLVDTNNSLSYMISKKSTLPNISVLFIYNGSDLQYYVTRSFNLRYKTKQYLDHCFEGLCEKQKKLDDLLVSCKPFYVFGMSREFFYLYRNTRLSNCHILGLIDDTPYKQHHCTVDGMPIMGRHVLSGVTDPVMITATAHTDTITKVLAQVGFNGTIIEI